MVVYYVGVFSYVFLIGFKHSEHSFCLFFVNIQEGPPRSVNGAERRYRYVVGTGNIKRIASNIFASLHTMSKPKAADKATAIEADSEDEDLQQEALNNDTALAPQIC